MAETTEIVGFEEWLVDTANHFDASVKDVVNDLAEKTVDEARRDHPYRDITYNLTNSIRMEPATGSILTDDRIEATVIADTDYAENVEERRGKILEPAWERVAATAENEIDIKINAR